MCGINGIIGRTQNREAVLEEMMRRMIHRGPDSEGTHYDDDAALGFRRLSIIDLAGGDQPLSNEDGTVWVIFNGEIYNYQDLTRELTRRGHVFRTQSDTECLVHAYEEFGEAMLSHLRGMFAFAIWDSREKLLFAARDFFGIKPLYYMKAGGALLFSSEIKSLLACPDYEPKVNEEALEEYLSFQYSVLPETFFSGIYKLMPGHAMTYKNGELIIRRYFDPMLSPEEPAGQEEWIDKIDEVLGESISAHMISDVEVASFLSSGVDSSYITSRFHGTKTFTVGFLSEDSAYNEISYAKKLSAVKGYENVHKTISRKEFWEALPKVIYHMDEPLADASAVALYFVNKITHEAGIKVSLSGEGSDEFFGGYNIYHEVRSLAAFSKMPGPIRRGIGKVGEIMPHIKGRNFLIRAGKTVEERFIGNAYIFTEDERKTLLKHTCRMPSPSRLLASSYRKASGLDDVSKMQYIDLNYWLPGDILLKADKMGMANSVEVRVPFLDRLVFQCARNIPHQYKVHGKTTKYAFRKAALRHLPQETADKKKLGFPVPIRIWLKEEPCYSIVKELFLSDTAARYFSRGALMKLLAEHREDKADNSRKIWTVFIFLLWHRIFFEGEDHLPGEELL